MRVFVLAVVSGRFRRNGVSAAAPKHKHRPWRVYQRVQQIVDRSGGRVRDQQLTQDGDCGKTSASAATRARTFSRRRGRTSSAAPSPPSR
jgi:hypothetical protein